jgi:hypothetical protein
MALVGGGGAGNVAGSNPAGVGTSINYIGDHAYAYAASEAAATTSDTRLNFSTGALYIVARLTCNGSADPTGTDNGNITVWDLNFDSQLVVRIKTETAQENMPTSLYNDIIIPPYTNVTVLSQSNGDSAGRLTTCSIVGRVYA